MADPKPRVTDSGIELQPVYGPEDPSARDLGRPGEPPFTRGIYPTMYRGRLWTMRQYAGMATRRGDERPLPLPAGARADRACRSRSTCRRRWAWTPTTRGPRARSARSASRSTRSRTCARLFDGIPLDQVTTSMTINATAAILLLLYELVAEEQGVAADADRRHRPERHPQGVRRARHLHLSAEALDAAHHRPVRVLRASASRSWNTISICGYHMREAGATAAQEIAFTLADGIAYVQAALDAGLDGRRVRAAAVVLLRLPHELLRGGREVPRRAADVGADHDRAVRREGSEERDAPLPHADRRAPRSPRSSPRTTSCGRRSRRWPRCWAARSRCTRTLRRGAGAADRATRRGSPCARSRSSRYETGVAATADPLGGSYFVESLTDEIERRATEYIEKIDGMGGAVAAIEAGFDPGRDPRGRVPRSSRRSSAASA